MSPRGQKQNEKMRADALEKITMASLKVFSEYGYHGTTMKQIARQTGMSYGLLYHYFPSKEAVFRYIVDSSFDASTGAATAMLKAPGNAWDKIEQFSTFLVEEAVKGESSAYFLVSLQAMTQAKSISGFHAHVTARVRNYYELLAPLIAEAQQEGRAAPGDPMILAVAYFSFVQGLALLSIQGSGVEQSITPDILLKVLKNPASSEAAPSSNAPPKSKGKA